MAELRSLGQRAAAETVLRDWEDFVTVDMPLPRLGPGAGFAFVLDQALPVGFTLQVRETTFRSEEAEVTTSSSSYSYQWQNKIPDLSDGDIVEVSLTPAE